MEPVHKCYKEANPRTNWRQLCKGLWFPTETEKEKARRKKKCPKEQSFKKKMGKHKHLKKEKKRFQTDEQ